MTFWTSRAGGKDASRDRSVDGVILTALAVEFDAFAVLLRDATWISHPEGSRYLVGELNTTTGDDQRPVMIALASIGRGNEDASFVQRGPLSIFDRVWHYLWVSLAASRMSQ